MLGFPYFSHDLIKKYSAVFGSTFNDIRIQRIDQANTLISDAKVPLVYGSKEWTLARITQNPDLQKPVAIELPIMSFQLLSTTYAPARKLVTTKKIIYRDPDDPDSPKYAYNPVPFDFNFNLYVYTKSVEDGNKIIEQIVPFFVPDFVPTVHLIPDLNIKADIPIVLRQMSMEDHNEGNLSGGTDRRTLIWTLGFVLKGFLYGPVRTSAIIKFVSVNFIDKTNLGLYETVTVEPGLDANGDPTTNVNNSIFLIITRLIWGITGIISFRSNTEISFNNNLLIHLLFQVRISGIRMSESMPMSLSIFNIPLRS
jgi:hypothetical protein